MIVRYYATVRDLTGVAEERFDDAPVTLGERLRRATLSGDDLAPTVMILVNGRNAVFSGGTQTPLTAENEVSIFPPVGGG